MPVRQRGLVHYSGSHCRELNLQTGIDHNSQSDSGEREAVVCGQEI
jgi:hypothetical protein